MNNIDISAIQAIDKTYNADRALEMCAELQSTDSRFTFPDFRKTSNAIVGMMEQIGLADIEIHSFPADGRTKYGDWIAPRAWDIRAAELAIDTGSGFESIASREDSLCSVMMYSAPTKNSEPVYVDIVGESNIDAFPGNLVFVETPDNLPPSKLDEHGAIGIVTDFMPLWPNCRSRDDVLDVTLWNNSYLAPANEYSQIGFQITPRRGDRIKKLLAKNGGRIPARAMIDAELYDGEIDFVTGVLPGEKPGEVAVFSHLYEPGANDNASGCALSLESVATLKRLIDDGTIPPLGRSIRLCFPFEIISTLAYFQRYPERMEQIVAGLNPDMVGPDMEKVRSRLLVHGTPDSAPSYVDALMSLSIEEFAQKNHLFRWSEKRFFINDNIVVDPAISIPSPALVCLRDRFYHSDHDRVSNLSSETLGIIGKAVSLYLYQVSRGALGPARSLANELVAREIQNINAVTDMSGVPVTDILEFRADAAIRRISTVSEFLLDAHMLDSLNRYIEDACDSIRAFTESCKKRLSNKTVLPAWNGYLQPDSKLAAKAKSLFPRRTTIGTCSMTKWLADTGSVAGNARWNYKLNAPLFRTDGTHNIYEIWRAHSCEFIEPHSLAELILLFESLEQEGHVTIGQAPPCNT